MATKLDRTTKRAYPFKVATTILKVSGEGVQHFGDARVGQIPSVGQRVSLRYGTGHLSLYTVTEVVCQDDHNGDLPWDMPYEAELVLLPYNKRGVGKSAARRRRLVRCAD
jgi:hypothetical protein